jgi:hypothetical protein
VATRHGIIDKPYDIDLKSNQIFSDTAFSQNEKKNLSFLELLI